MVIWFNWWDGSLLASKFGYSSCEITMSLKDEHAYYYY